MKFKIGDRVKDKTGRHKGIMTVDAIFHYSSGTQLRCDYARPDKYGTIYCFRMTNEVIRV